MVRCRKIDLPFAVKIFRKWTARNELPTIQKGIGLFDEFYLWVDSFFCFFLTLVEEDLVLFEKVVSFCVDGDDERAEFLYITTP